MDTFIEIAKALGQTETCNDLIFLKSRLEQPNKDLVIPLVGEFSSGKTSLINVLTDNKQLETASKATTATIFEIRFGCERCHAEIVGDGGNSVEETEEIGGIKNAALQDVDLVRIYDTSKKVSSSLVLVDTPGLSSSDPRHKLALTGYLPQADAIFLVADVNQQITRSLIDFVNNTKLVERPMYLILTKCDTKTANEVKAVKEYIKRNINLPVENIICVSAATGDLQELYALFDELQSQKNRIVTQAINGRIKEIAQNLSGYIDELLQSAKTDAGMDDKIASLQGDLKRLGGNIEKLIRDASSSISEKGEDCIRKFKDNVFMRLDSIVQAQGHDCDVAVQTAVNTIAQTALLQFKKDVQYVLINMARERQRSVEEVPLQSLESLDLSGMVLNELTYNLELSAMGHQYDKTIGTVVKVAGAVAVIAGGAVMIGKAATGAAVKTAAMSGAKVVDNVVDMADTATDLASIASNRKTQRRLDKVADYASKFQKNMEKVDQWDTEQGQKYTSGQKGLIETGVAWITEKYLGKPQRRRAINEYISGTLVPEFTMQIDSMQSELTRTVGQLLHEEVQNRTSTMEQMLHELKAENASAKEEFARKIEQLKEYKNILKNA